MFTQSLAFVDLETTGANPAHDRVIEIGIVKVTNGQIEYEWSTLVDPGEHIPAMIQSFIGITDEMVRGAPTFNQVAEQVRDMLEGSLFIAHNARFDYGFLKNEFRRLDMVFQPPVLCTVKLSRALYREHHKHGLDALIARHNLACAARHRALGDARVLWDFVQLVHQEKTPEEIERAMTKAMKSPSLPSGLDRVAIDALPETPGVYLFYGEGNASADGEEDLPLYIGKALNMRSRAQSHFAADHSSGRAMRLAQETKRIEWVETAGELGALLLEARLVKQKSPIHNRQLRRNEELCALRYIEDAPEVAVELVPYNTLTMDDVPTVYGCFKSKREAINTMRELAAEHGLCHKRLGIEPTNKGRAGPCFAQQIKRCRGFCVGRESAAQHDLRLKTALSLVKLKNWPFPGRIAIREYHAESGQCDWHLFESWCYLATVKNEADLYDAAKARYDAGFDYDTYRILKRELERQSGKFDIVTLS